VSADKYEFLEWYKLDPLIRAYIIPMIEGIRPGANLAMYKMEQEYPAYFLQQKPLLLGTRL